MRTKKPSISKLKKELDRIFSLYVRYRDRGQCITCSVKRPPKEMQNGHYIARSNMATRFDEWNCNAQCFQCNVFKSGNYPKYALALKDKYGDRILEELDKKSQEIRKFTRADYEEMIVQYTKLLDDMI